ncbi:MAG: bifunctional (p)ppGpp synthetase/guanosine-3',5'-bis(diphosphate) 3'-pyrophosphohydrolase [Dokdonella sp.]
MAETTPGSSAVEALLPRAQALIERKLDAAPALRSIWDASRAERDQVQALLAELGTDAAAQVASMLHAGERCGIDFAATELAAFGSDIDNLIEGQRAAERVWSIYAARRNNAGAEGLRRLLLAIIRDLRVVLILLAQQLVSMRLAADLPEAERRALAQLSTDIHAPLASRLGVWQLKWELEDLAFRYLQPDTYRRIARLLDERRADREAWIASTRQQLEEALQAAGVRAEVAGRPKHIYSIWRKMQKKGLDFSELYDVRALRVMVDDVATCYAALGVVHSTWPFLPGEFDDYIASPKGNNYQSLHTAVIGPQGRTLEVQIRSHAMHEFAERGFAAHWRYKEGGGGDASFERKIAWMRQLLEERDEHADEAALLADFRTDVLEDRIYLLTPKGEVIDLPQGATVLDFAYLIHTDVGHRCRGAKVNGRIVPLVFQPASGDRVEILTGKTLEPRRDWLLGQNGYLNTARAREKVRNWFNRVDLQQNISEGRSLLERELKRLALSKSDLDALPARFQRGSMDELYVAVALGDITPGQIARSMHESAAPPAPPPLRVPRAPARDKDALVIDGVGNLLTSLARCCQPVPGDAIAGFITRGRGISVHRHDCAQLAHLRDVDAERVIDVEWGGARKQAYEIDLLIRGYDRKWLLKDITTVIAAANIQLLSVNSRVDAASSEADVQLSVRVTDFEQLSALIARLAGIPNVIEARRLA